MHQLVTEGPFLEQSPYDYDDSERKTLIIDPKIVCGMYRPRSYSTPTTLHDPEYAPRSDVTAQLEPAGRGRSVSFGGAAPQSPTLILRRGVDAPEFGTVVEYTKFITPSLDAESQKLDLGAPTVPLSRWNFNPTRRPSWFPPVRKDSFEIKPLPYRWQFPSSVGHYQSTPGALDGLDESSFERNVTEGYILEDSIGFHWTANGKYLLFKQGELTSESGEDSKAQQLYLEGLGPALYTHGLFSHPHPLDPDLTTTTPASTGDIPKNQTSELFQRRQNRNPSILRTQTFKFRSTSLEDFRHTPILQQIAMPDNAINKESFPIATENPIKQAIENAVTSDHATIIPPTNPQHSNLTPTTERTAISKPHTPTLPTSERPPTPIISRHDLPNLIKSPKDSVRFNASSLSLDDMSVVRMERVVDNEGKTQMVEDGGEGKMLKCEGLAGSGDEGKKVGVDAETAIKIREKNLERRRGERLELGVEEGDGEGKNVDIAEPAPPPISNGRSRRSSWKAKRGC